MTIGTRSAATASDGRYQITGLVPGVPARTVTASGYSDYSDTVALQSGVNVLADIGLVEAPPPPPPP